MNPNFCGYVICIPLLLLVRAAFAYIGPDGICNLYALVPFANHDGSPSYGLTGDTRGNNGFSHVAAALMAIHHFNERNSTVVPEVAVVTKDCNVTLHLEKVFNAVPQDYTAIRSIATDGPPNCAFLGPFDDLTGNDMSVVAQSHSIPMVTTRTFDVSIALDHLSQFSTSITPDLVASSAKIVEYLLYRNRTNYVAFLYDLDRANYQRREALSIQLDYAGISWISSVFSAEECVQSERSVFHAMKVIKDAGFRTIVIAQSDPFYSYQRIADAAEALHMTDGGYFYLWYDTFEPSICRQNNTNVTKLTMGSAWIASPARYHLLGSKDPFMSCSNSQGPDFVRDVMDLNPFGPGEPGYVDAKDNHFQTVRPEFGSAQMYDAVMSVGLGACRAQRSQKEASSASAENGPISGVAHQKAIREQSFFGATGQIDFGDPRFGRGGARRGDTSYWTALNLLPSFPIGYQFADFIEPGRNGGSWYSNKPYIYADGTTNPPLLLRDEPEQNYLSDSLRIVGLCLMGITMVVALACCVWVLICRKHKVLLASQPLFLYLICIGAFVQTSAILPSSIDESHGCSTEQFDRACMSIPWLFTLGHITVYSSLFSKLWRVNKVLQFTRRKIEIRHVAWPMLILVAVALVLLLLWTVLDPLIWKREEIDATTGESIGMCESDNIFAFVAPLIAVSLVPSVLTCFMAYKTKDVDETYTESWWIFILVLLQVEVLIIAIPVVVILRNVSTDGRYLGLVFILWSFPTSTLGLIFCPKVMAYRRAIGGESGPKYKRGERGRSRVSGIPESTNSDAPDHHDEHQHKPALCSVAEEMEVPASHDTNKVIA